MLNEFSFKRSGCLCILLLTLFCHVSLAQRSLSDKKISIQIDNLSLKDALNEITKKSGISFSYNPKKIPLDQKITYQAKEKSIEEILNAICELAGLEYQHIENQIILQEKKKKEKIPEQTATLSGFIKDKNSGEALIGALVIINDSQTGTSTNAFGFYSITLPEDKYKINFSFVGYERQSEEIDLHTSFTKDIQLNEAPPVLDEVIVTEEEKESVKEVQASKMDIRPNTVEQRPALLGEVDVIKSLESIPGIKLHSDGSTFYSVRGGSRDQNAVMIDDAIIYNPSHLLGLFSTVIPDAVNDITLYKGDMPASLGGRVSSLLDIRTKKGNDQHMQAWGNLGLISTKLGIEGPIKKDESSFLLSARVSRLKWFFKINEPDIKKFQFYDFTGKTNFRINQKNRIYFSFYSGSDNFLTGNSGITWGNVAGTFRWNHIFNDRLFMNTTLLASGYDYNLYTDLANNTRWNSHVSNGALKLDLGYFINPQNQVDFGFSISGYGFNPGNLKSNLDLTTQPKVSVKNSTELVAYVNHKIEWNKKWEASYGLRFTAWTNTGDAFEYTFDKNKNPIDTSYYKKGEAYKTYGTIEPRFSLRYLLTESSSLKFTASHNVQNVHLISNSTSPFTSLEVWLPSSINIKPQTANQVTVGYYKSFYSSGFAFEAETFYKSMNNQIDFESHAQTFLNPLLEGELRFGKAKSYGIEFLLRKETGRLRGWAGYSYSRAKRKFNDINEGKTYNAFYDRPNQINLMLAYDISLRWNLGLNWNFSTGAPYSSPTGFYTYNGEQVPIYGQKNNDRLPDYHRLDLSATVRINKNPEKKFQHHLSFSIFNFYGRKNALFINYNKQTSIDGTIGVPSDLLNGNYITSQFYLLQFVPSLTYNFKWR